MQVHGWRLKCRGVVGLFFLTPFELLLVAVLAGLVVWGAIPQYHAWLDQRVLEEEQQTVLEIRSALSDIGISGRRFPRQLDSFAGDSSNTPVVFGAVLAIPPPAGSWRMQDGLYIGPAGGRYRYDSATRQFISVPVPDTNAVHSLTR